MSSFGFNKIFTLKVSNPIPKVDTDFDGKHTKVMEAILPYAKPRPQSNLVNVEITDISRKTSVMYLLLPEWAKMFAPYNLARLIALTKSAGYETHAIDINAKAGVDAKNWDIDFDPWNGAREWKWLGNTYHTQLHQHLEPLLEKYLDEIGRIKPTVVGFTIYYCNEEPTKWMAKEIKKRYPETVIIVGGPQCHQSYWEPIPEFDYIVSGEGEKILLDVLEEIESGVRHTEQKWIRQQEGERLNLDALPKPDYSHFDFSDYSMPNGVNAELSRGCTAKCVFCSETHFWKYRGRMATSIIDEIADLYFNHGVDVIWFLDSLVNGNLNQLRAFAKGVVARGLDIHWTGYARCDGRMDLEYFKDLKDSGCLSLSYGIESGSNKVLATMNKGVTVEEIEQNLRDGGSLGIEAFTNWIIGFPTEEYQDIYETMTMIVRNRNHGITDIAGGHGFTIPPDTIVAQSSEQYGIIKSFFLNNWIKADYSNSKIHRLVRIKSFNILLHHLITRLKMQCSGMRPTIDQFYKLNIGTSINENIPYEEFDFSIIKPNINPFADSLVNEIWPVLRLLYRMHGAYSIEIINDPEKDLNEFSDRLAGNYTANHKFTIDDDGNWTADFDYKFVQGDDAWKYNDYSRAESVAARRARALAVPDSGGDITWDMRKYERDIALLDELKQTDFSFTYKYNGSGKW